MDELGCTKSRECGNVGSDMPRVVTNYLFLFLKTSWVFFQTSSVAMEVRAFMQTVVFKGVCLRR